MFRSDFNRKNIRINFTEEFGNSALVFPAVSPFSIAKEKFSDRHFILYYIIL